MQFPRLVKPPSPDPKPAQEQASAEYCRKARRLRHELRDQPIRLHQSLSKLTSKPAETPDTEAEAAEASPHPYMRLARPYTGGGLPLQCPPLAAEAFAAEVDNCCCEGVLRYSQRASLLRHAKCLGISRFEANLIIATVLHRHACEESEQPRKSSRLPMVIAFIFALETVIGLAAWWFFG